LERETVIEPATSSLGSCGQSYGRRKIKHIERGVLGRNTALAALIEQNSSSLHRFSAAFAY